MSFFFSSDFPKVKKNFSVAIVHAEYNEELVQRILEHTFKGLKKCGVAEEAIEIFSVPGALELPFMIKKVMATGDFDGVIALGVVIRGETLHFELVANEASRGLMELNLHGQIPVICGLLCTENEEQVKARFEKGIEFAKSLVQMMNLNLEFENEEEPLSF